MCVLGVDWAFDAISKSIFCADKANEYGTQFMCMLKQKKNLLKY